MATTERGSFILLEGCDRSGKTTQAKLLYKNLQEKGIKVEFARFPDRTSEIGKVIDQYLTSSSSVKNKKSIHLLFSANRWEVMDTIKEKMEQGITYVIDRYSYSGIVYSVANGLDEDWCKAMERGLPKPDVVLYLDITPEAAAQRGDYGKERYEKQEFQQKVRANYLHLVEENWKVIEANQDMEVIANQLLDISLETIKESKHKPIQTI